MVFKKKETSTQPSTTVNKTDKKTIKTKSGKKLKLNFGPYIARIQKRADSKTRLSLKAIQSIDGMITNLLQEFSEIIGELNRKTKKHGSVEP